MNGCKNYYFWRNSPIFRKFKLFLDLCIKVNFKILYLPMLATTEQRDQAVLERKRRIEEERKARIFDPKARTKQVQFKDIVN